MKKSLSMLAALAFAPLAAAVPAAETPVPPDTAVVYFTRDISPAGLLKIYAKVNGGISGKVAIKLHTGEPHGPNIIPVPMVKALQQAVPGSTIVETNTLYGGGRSDTPSHRRTLQINGFTFSKVDIMDEEGAVMLPVKGGRYFKEMSLGSHILNYNSMIVLTHFKGHEMGGYGGSMKNIAIGCADAKVGKRMIHSNGWNTWYYTKDIFMERMAESAKATVDHFGLHMAFINVLRRMSIDCDCVGISAAEPTLPDIGILASTNIAAVDQASIDMVFAMPESQKRDLWDRITSLHGLRQLSYMKELGMGSGKYKLVNIDQ